MSSKIPPEISEVFRQPTTAGPIVSMVKHKDHLYIACEFAVYRAVLDSQPGDAFTVTPVLTVGGEHDESNHTG